MTTPLQGDPDKTQSIDQTTPLPNPTPAQLIAMRGQYHPSQGNNQPWTPPSTPTKFSDTEFKQYENDLNRSSSFQNLIGAAKWEQNKPSVIALRQLGYLPTAWEDPRTVVKYYNFLQTAPKGWKPPTWLDPAAVTEAYKWFAFRNGGTPPSQWKFLPTDDPGRSWLQSVPQPPDYLKMPTDQWYSAMPANPTDVSPDVAAQQAQDQAALVASGGTNPVLDWSKVPGWQKVAYYAASNPATAPLVQGAALAIPSLLTGNVPGLLSAAGITVSQYAAQTKIPIIKDVGNAINVALMWGMQKAEQAIGMANQLSIAMPTNQELENGGAGNAQYQADIQKNNERINSILKDPQAAWKASQLYYETSLGQTSAQNIAPFIQWVLTLKKPVMAQSGQVWVLPEPIYDTNGNLTGWNYHPDPVTIPSGYTLEDARKRVLAGENPDKVMAEFRQVYGFSGASGDLLGDMIANPLTLLPKAETGAAKGIIGIAGKIAETSGNADAVLAADRWAAAGQVSQEGLFGRGGLLDSYKTLIRSTVPVDELTAFDRSFLGRTITGLTPEGTIKGFDNPIKPNLLQYITNLTPDSKARVWHQFVLENWKTIAIENGMDPVETTRLWSAYANGDMQTLKDAGATYLMSPEAYTVLPSAKSFLPEAVDLLTEWQTSQAPRDTVNGLSAILEEKPADVVKAFLAKDPETDFQHLQDKAATSDTPEAKQFLADVQAGKITAETIADSIKVFEGGKVALDPQEWATKFINALSDHTGEWLKDFYGLKPDSAFFQSQQLLKSVQSLLLLSLSPSYPVNNTINNIVTRSVSGVGGFLPDWKIKEVMGRFGWVGDMAPERLRSGVGAAAEGIDTAGQSRPGENVIRDAMTDKNFLSMAKRAISNVNNKVGIFSKISQMVERSESQQAFAIAADKFYGRVWRQGIGFDAMPANLDMALRNIDPSYPDLVKNAIESGYRFKDIQDALSNGATSRNISTYINDAAQKLNMQPADVADALSTVGVKEYLESELPKAKTDAQIRQVFDNTDKVFNDYVDRVHGQNLRDYAGNVTQRLQSEGFAAVNDLWTEMFSREMDVKNVSDLAWDKAYSEANANWEYTDLRRQILGTAAQETQARYRRFYEWQEATLKGVIEGMGMDDATRRDYLTDMIDIHQKRADFFKLKSDEVRKFFNTEFQSKEERNSAWYSLLDDQNRRYEKLISDEGVTAQTMDTRLEQWFEKTFGPGSGSGVKNWRAGLRYLLDQRGRMVVAFRDSIKDLAPEERDAAWQRFKPSYFDSFVGEKRLEAQGLAKIWTAVTGQETVPAKMKNVMGSQPETPAEAAPTPITQPLAQAELITPEVRQQVQVANNAAEMASESVRQVAQQHGIPTADENGKPIPGADTHLLNVIRKYGGPEAKTLASIADATPEMADRAFAEQKRVQDMQVTLDQELAAHKAIQEVVQQPVQEVVQPETAPAQPEPAAVIDPLAQKQADVFALINRKPLAEMPEVLREPLRATLQEMSDEFGNGRAKRSLLDVIKAKGGINIKDLADVTGENKVQRAWGPGLFSKNGLPMDTMASELATEEGFPIDLNSPMDNGGTRQLVELVRSELAGNKTFSSLDEGQPDTLPDWYKNLSGVKNKPQKVQQTINSILSGTDNASVGIEPSATETAIKSEAFGRMADLAAEDGTIAQATGFPYDAGKFTSQVDYIAQSINGASLPDLQAMSDALDTLTVKAPVDLNPAAFEHWMQVKQVISDQMDILEQKNTIIQAHTQAEQVVAQAELRSHIEWNKQEVADHFRQAGLPPDQADAMSEMFDGTAKWFQKETGRSMADFYDLAIEAVKHGTPEDLQALFEKVRGGKTQFQSENAADYYPMHPKYINNGNAKMLGAWGITEDGQFHYGIGMDHHELVIHDGLATPGASDVEKIFVERGRFGTFKDDPNTPFIAAFDTSGKDYEYVIQHWDELTTALKSIGLEKNPVFYGGEQAMKSDPFAEYDKTTGILFQADKVYRAAIDFTDSMKAIYTLFDDTNASSAPHEFGHHLRRMLYAVSDMTGSPELARDIQTIEDFAGVQDGKWTTDSEEMFAKGFEKYLAEGVAPTPALTRVFESFKGWLLDVYKSITGSKIDVPLNDATRQVFAKMLGADQQSMIPEEVTPLPPAPEPGFGFAGENVQGNMFAPQQYGLGLNVAKVETAAPEVAPAPVPEPGKTTLDNGGRIINTGDIVKVQDGGQARVDGVSSDGTIIIDGTTNNPRILHSDQVTRVAGQESMFGNPGELVDFGDKLGGARKDKAAAAQAQLAQVAGISPDDLAKMKLSEIFPKSVIDNIEDERLAALAQTIRDVIPSKPRDAYRIRRWVEQVKTVQGLIDIANQQGVDEVMTRIRANRSLAGVADKVELLQQVSRDQWSRIGNVQDYPRAVTYKDGQQVPAPFAAAKVDGATIHADNLEELITKVTEKLGTAKPESTMRFEVRGSLGKYFINKAGDSLYRKLMEFTDPKEALDYRQNHYDELVSAWEKVKESDNVLETDVRRAENQPRTGQDYRQGKDATPQMFLDTFGFRGVEFGNWVSQGANLKERQGMLNATYDALMDLSDITGVPPKALSLNGELGLGMGSRGSGRASAHFEPDAVVINLTKTRGAGALAHEWFHALDNYFARMRGDERYITNNPEPSTPVEGVRPEMEQSFAELVKALNDSPMKSRAQLLDKGKGSEGYWSKVVERAARSFENYVVYKMGENGYQNDYLANVATIEEFIRDPGRYPYLLDEELKPVADAFDNLFGNMQTKQGENGKVTLFQSDNKKVLFQDGGEIPTLPVGGYDQSAQTFDESGALDEIWGDKVRPILDAMKESALKPEKTMLAESLPADTKAQLDDYMRQIKGQIATANHYTMRWAEGMRDYALLPYNRQYGFDKLLSVGVPYEFWMTRTMVNSVIRFMDRPAWYSNYVRLNQFHNTYVNNLPSRLKDKYFLPMPFLPSWAGNGVWINPQQQLFPFANFLQPLQQIQTDQDTQIRNAERVVQTWQQDGKLTADQASAALANHSGSDWERAVAQAALENNAESSTAFDYMSTILSPALYATIPYYLATHKKLTSGSWPSGQLPITRFGSGVKTALAGTSLEWLGNIAGGLAAPENAVRKVLKLNEFGDWGDYYTDRQLTNMAADGTISSDQARQAMIERKGSLYDQAVTRVRQELMLKTPEMAPLYAAAHGAQFDALLALAPSLFSGGLLPEGEIIVNGDKQEYNKAWDAYNSGDKKAITKFFDAHPEYNARLALYDNPDDRLKNFMISEIWDRYTALGDTYRRQARTVLGADFSIFLTPKNGVDFPIDKLAAWAQALGGMAPTPADNTLTTPVTPAYETAQKTGEIQWYPEEVAAVMDDYYQQRDQKFPNWYAIQTGYYSLPASEHSSYLMRFPELKKYWTWKDAYQANYPGMEQWFSGTVYKNTDTSAWPAALVQAITDYAMTGVKLSKGAKALLDTLWVSAGSPYGTSQAWLDSDIAPSVLNSAMPNNQLPQTEPVATP